MPTNTASEPFVKRVEMAIMQYVILNKAQEGEVTRENLKSAFRGNLQMSSDHFDHCITQLVSDGHLKEIDGGKYTATDDGREDVQKLQNLVLELPNAVQQGKSGGGQRPGMQQPQSAGGMGSTGGAQGQNPGQQPANKGSPNPGQNPNKSGQNPGMK